jgi:hypothetical protein
MGVCGTLLNYINMARIFVEGLYMQIVCCDLTCTIIFVTKYDVHNILV